MCDYFEVQCDVFRNLKGTYTSYLKKYISENNSQAVEYLLNKIVVPNELLNYKYLYNASNEILDLLVESKRQTDEIVETVLQLIDKNKYSDEIDFDCITLLSKEIVCKYSDENYKTFFLLNLLSNHGTMKPYSVDNIVCNYRNLRYYCDKVICDGLYYANKDFVSKFLNVVENNWNISWKFRFEPMSRQSHKQIMQWIIDN